MLCPILSQSGERGIAIAQAAKLYLANPAEKLPIFGGKTFAEFVLEDFKQFRAKGITHPDMAKIEKLLREGKPP